MSERVYTGSPADVAREADEDAYPWSQPGEVPTEPGPYWVWAKEGDPAECNLIELPDGRKAWVVRYEADSPMTEWAMRASAKDNAARFRQRWTPAPPREA